MERVWKMSEDENVHNTMFEIIEELIKMFKSP